MSVADAAAASLSATAAAASHAAAAAEEQAQEAFAKSASALLQQQRGCRFTVLKRCLHFSAAHHSERKTQINLGTDVNRQRMASGPSKFRSVQIRTDMLDTIVTVALRLRPGWRRSWRQEGERFARAVAGTDAREVRGGQAAGASTPMDAGCWSCWALGAEELLAPRVSNTLM